MKDNCNHTKAPTSYHMQNPDTVFKELNLKPEDTFLDIGCGAGDYSIHASKIIRNTGKIYALDKPEELITLLKEKIEKEKINNIYPKIADITKELPIENNSIDICLISTVLHAIDFNKYKEQIFKEIKRILKPSGHLAIIECSKKDFSRGPPEAMRLDSEEIISAAKQSDFKKISYTDLGFNYLIQFKLE